MNAQRPKFKAAEGLNNRSLTYSVSTFPLGCSLHLCRFPTALLRKLGTFQCLEFCKDCEGMNTFRAAPMTLKLKPWWIWERRLWGLLRLEPWSSPLPRLRPRRWANGLINLRAMARNHALAFHEKEMIITCMKIDYLAMLSFRVCRFRMVYQNKALGLRDTG